MMPRKAWLFSTHIFSYSICSCLNTHLYARYAEILQRYKVKQFCLIMSTFRDIVGRNKPIADWPGSSIIIYQRGSKPNRLGMPRDPGRAVIMSAFHFISHYVIDLQHKYGPSLNCKQNALWQGKWCTVVTGDVFTIIIVIVLVPVIHVFYCGYHCVVVLQNILVSGMKNYVWLIQNLLSVIECKR